MLAKAKSINDLGVAFDNSTNATPWSDQRKKRAERKWLELFDRPLPLAEEFFPYFGSRMHDCGVFGIEQTGSILRVRLDSINASDFSSYLAATLDLPPPEAIWPVDLLLHDPSYVRTARVDPWNGGLRFDRWSSVQRPEFLYDWFFQQDGRL